MTGLSRLTALICGLVVCAAAPAESDSEAGRIKAETCRGCHAIANYKSVYPTYSVPRLAGQNEAYLVLALKAYSSGERSHPTMRSQATTLTEQDMQDIAAYFATQTGGES